MKNEFCDYLSRNDFDKKIECSSEQLAREAFVRMDAQIELWMQKVMYLTDQVKPQIQYDRSEFTEIIEQFAGMDENSSKTLLIGDQLYFWSNGKLFCERKLCIPKGQLREVLQLCHEQANHPGPERTILQFLKHFTPRRASPNFV
jgi:hypothetical protein